MDSFQNTTASTVNSCLLGVINMGITDSWQYVAKGGVLLVAVIFDVVSSRSNGK